jgi:hypothetical protein
MGEINGLSYPDSGNRLEDASVLRNAVYFSTAERAYSAELVLKEPLKANQQTLNFMVVRAFEEFMTSTEDLLGWLFVLKEWKPGEAQHSLFILLDRIHVGRGKYSEDNAVSLLTKVDEQGFRRLFHIPKDEELISSGMSVEAVESVKRSVPFKLDGWLRIAKRRAEQDRGEVGMFNKLKHHMLAFPTQARGKSEVWMPYYVDMEEDQIKLGSGWLGANPNNIRKLVGDAIVAQAVLHDTLALILMTRYKEQYYAQDWVVRAYQTYFEST